MRPRKITYNLVLKDVAEGPRRDFLRLMIETEKYTPEYMWMFAYEAFHRRNTSEAVEIMNEMVRYNPKRFGKEIYITKEDIEEYWSKLGL